MTAGTVSDGAWFVIARGAHAPHGHAHRLVDELELGKWGERRTVCGLAGRAIAVAEGVHVYACQRCEHQ